MVIEIRTLTEIHEMYAAVELQKVYWGTDVESLVPGQTLFTIAKSGGHVIAAYDGVDMVGMLVGLMASYGKPAHDHLKIYSKRMVVLPQYRGQNIAQRLKLKQRDLAIEQGLELITWTFDPLLSLNAYFNIRKLGCICKDYIINYHGNAPDETGLAILGTSDRLVASWITDAPGILDRIHDKYVSLTMDNYLQNGAVILNPSKDVKGVTYPAENLYDTEGEFALIEIPSEFRGLVNAIPDVARNWQSQIRDLFTTYMDGRGYVVTDYLRHKQDDRHRSFYVLSRRY